MQLTTQQQQTLKAAIAAETNPAFVTLRQANNEQGMADFYNAVSTFVVWQTAVPIDTITDAIDWAKMTPAQAIPATGSDAQLAWIARANMCQGKQFNLQNLLIGKQLIAASRPNIRAAFQDCLTALPSTASGTNQSAGWTAVQSAMQRTCSVIERLFATGTGTTAAPGTLVVEGTLSAQDTSDALRS
jgi:hypothetical protein